MKITKRTLQIHELPGAAVVNREITVTHSDMALVINGETVTPGQLRQYTDPLPNFRSVDDEIDAINASENVKDWLKSRGISEIRQDLGLLPLMIMSKPDPVAETPRTSTILHMRDTYLSEKTQNKIRHYPGSFEATRLAGSDKDRPEWLVPIPASFDTLPEDLAACMLFARGMGADFVMFAPDGPRYYDIDSPHNQVLLDENTD